MDPCCFTARAYHALHSLGSTNPSTTKLFRWKATVAIGNRLRAIQEHALSFSSGLPEPERNEVPIRMLRRPAIVPHQRRLLNVNDAVGQQFHRWNLDQMLLRQPKLRSVAG